MICQIKNIKKKITELLTEIPRLRDSDDKLIANIWFEQIGVMTAREMTTFNFLRLFSEGQLINPESIRRCRQKVQEQNPDLRGKSYKNRKTAGKEFKQQIYTV